MVRAPPYREREHTRRLLRILVHRTDSPRCRKCSVLRIRAISAYHNVWPAGHVLSHQVPEANTGMPDEQNYQSHLLPVNDAIQLLRSDARHSLTEFLIRKAYGLWLDTVEDLRPDASDTPGLSQE